MAGPAGFEPANAGIKTRCLTTWRRPKHHLIIMHYRQFVMQRRGIDTTGDKGRFDINRAQPRIHIGFIAELDKDR